MLLDVSERGASAWVPAAELAGRLDRAEPAQEELADSVRDGTRALVDVRNPAEVRDQPILGAIHVPGAHLVDHPEEVPDGPLALACASGYRARVVASVLRARGIDARHVEGAAFDLLVPAPFA
jgi:rhodanese-related sulfurtransferase